MRQNNNSAVRWQKIIVISTGHKRCMYGSRLLGSVIILTTVSDGGAFLAGPVVWQRLSASIVLAVVESLHQPWCC